MDKAPHLIAFVFRAAGRDADHSPLRRKEAIFGRAGLAISELRWMSGSGRAPHG